MTDKLSRLSKDSQVDDFSLEEEDDNHDFYDPVADVAEIIANGFDPYILNKIDDRDLPRAPNFLEWCTNNKFLGNRQPFPRQLQVALEFYNEACLDCSDPKLLGNMFNESLGEILSRIKMLEFGVCPKCGKTRLDFYNEGRIKLYNTLAACVGQRSGKTAMTGGMLATYHLHKFLCLSDPASSFGLFPGSEMYMLFVAVTAGQAEDTLWGAFKSAYDTSEWFKSLHSLLMYHEKKEGVRLLWNLDTYYGYGHKALLGRFASPNKKKLRGKTCFFTSIDEFGWFDYEAESNKVTMDGDEVNTALTRGLTSVRTAYLERFKEGKFDLPNAVSCNISSPADIRDNIMKTVRESVGSKHILGIHYPTWEFNPNISRESLSDEFKKNPITAARDFGAEPPITDSPFIENQKVVEKAATSKTICKFSLETFEDDFGDKSFYPKLIEGYTEKKIPRIISLDAGHSYNSFAIIMAHLEEEMVVVDAAIEITPESKTGEIIPVNFALTYEHCILKLVELFNIELVVSDRWQQLHQMSDLKNKGTDSDSYSMKWDDFCHVKAKFEEGLIKIPEPEIPVNSIKSAVDFTILFKCNPLFHLCIQILSVRKVGLMVTKPVNGQDDLFRALFLACAFLYDEAYKDRFNNLIKNKIVSTNRSLGSVSRYGQRTGSSSGIKMQLAGRGRSLGIVKR